jgi:uncharacterized protein with ParB-like and HNH nuclease domain
MALRDVPPKEIGEDEFVPIDPNVVDETEKEPSSPTIYGISSYGADYTVELLVKRMRSGVYVVPPFQRSYVWSIRKASRFIESLLLGLPVPGVFLYKEIDTPNYLIVDGHQRLKTLEYFLEDKSFGERKFRLEDVQDNWNGRTFDDLTDLDRRNLEDALIHVIIFSQDDPPENNSSIYHVFERLNTGGMTLTPQEIRNCINHGELTELLSVLNDHAVWRHIYGSKNKRLKDQELILRFLALFYDQDKYQRPMNEFLNNFMARNRDPNEQRRAEFQLTFDITVRAAYEALGDRAFRPERSLNAAVYDAVMVGLARRLSEPPAPDPGKVRAAYERLLENEEFQAAFRRATSDEESVKTRIRLATEYFAAT